MSKIILFVSQYHILTIGRGLGTGGVWGGRTPPRIRDLCSKKIFDKFSYLFGPPLDKNRSKAPEYVDENMIDPLPILKSMVVKKLSID